MGSKKCGRIGVATFFLCHNSITMDQGALAVAFGLCAGAGLSTTIGALFVFVPRFQNTAALAGSLAFAAGVMIYVSMIEIVVKSYDEFELHFDE